MKLKLLLLMLAALPFLACKITERKPVAIPSGFDWQGHRGCRGLLAENSLPAFLRALEYPQVRTLELDLAVSKDRQLIVTHEPMFNPAICLKPDGQPISSTEADNILLYQMTVAEIQAFDCGSIGNPRFPQQEKQKTYKPTLKEVVAAVRAKRPDIRWNMEIKSEASWDGLRHPPVQEFASL